jgi:hypothetical protein
MLSTAAPLETISAPLFHAISHLSSHYFNLRSITFDLNANATATFQGEPFRYRTISLIFNRKGILTGYRWKDENRSGSASDSRGFQDCDVDSTIDYLVRTINE